MDDHDMEKVLHDPAVDAVYDCKSEVIGPGSFRFKAEIGMHATDFNGVEVVRNHLSRTGRDECAKQSLAKSFDFIIDTASGDHPFDPCMALLKTVGFLVLVGFPREVKFSPSNLNPAPKQDWDKGNTDAAFMDGLAAGAVIFRDGLGNWIALHSFLFECKSAFEAEAITLEWAMKKAKEAGWLNIEWSVDALQVVKEVNDEQGSWQWDSFHSLVNIKKFLQEEGWSVGWEAREADEVAHASALFSRTKNVSFCIVKSCGGSIPSFVENLIVRDRIRLAAPMLSAARC
ncbi:hypothetical protein FNV43_RR25697 [Rhamnella rubrinervis]|uniref:RNase H type-1 domain-containing protein n=1 Tax=Rhamnella rubrinervis TaxID=2594499 RepID=A0A8K0DHA2_9ROSA|nr:hypothetical protein FNV43_RR25697 [Rhamnella rubrinervis]